MFALLGMLVSSLAEAADWPTWRGSLRDGISKETGLLQSWPAGGPEKAWTFNNAGLGYSPASGTGLHVGVALTNITAGGDSMTADVVVTDGGISSARPTTPAEKRALYECRDPRTTGRESNAMKTP